MPAKQQTKKTATSKAKTNAKSQANGASKAKGGNTATTAAASTAASAASESPATRYFKIVNEDGTTQGRFSGRKPKQAANKALTSILKERKETGKGTAGKVDFSIVECTRGSKHKQYSYEGQRKKLPEKMTVTIDNKEIVYEYSNVVKKVPKAQEAKNASGGKAASNASNAESKPAAKAVPAKGGKAAAKKAPVKRQAKKE